MWIGIYWYYNNRHGIHLQHNHIIYTWDWFGRRFTFSLFGHMPLLGNVNIPGFVSYDAMHSSLVFHKTSAEYCWPSEGLSAKCLEYHADFFLAKHHFRINRYVHGMNLLIPEISWRHQISSKPNYLPPSVLAIDMWYLCIRPTHILLDLLTSRLNRCGSVLVFVRDKYKLPGPNRVHIEEHQHQRMNNSIPIDSIEKYNPWCMIFIGFVW